MQVRFGNVLAIVYRVFQGIGILAAFAAYASASAELVADFYKGKHISLVVGFAGASSFDTYARLAASHLGRHIPGKPGIIVRNMPGAGALNATNYLYHEAPRDGTAIGMMNQTLALEQALKNPAARYDARKFNWIGRLAPVVQYIVVWHTAPVKSIQEVRAHQVILAATSPSGMTNLIPTLLDRLAGMKFKVILGYKGTNEGLVAMESGEVQGATATLFNLLISKTQWMRDKKIRVLVGNTEMHFAGVPQVPSMATLGRTKEERQILALYASTSELGRSLLAPPGVPHDRIAALRKAFDEMLNDLQFKDEVARRKMVDFGPLSGETLQKFVEKTLTISPAVTERAIKARAGLGRKKKSRK